MTFVEQIAPWAVESEREHGIPAAVTIAQAILESGRGTSELAVRAQALFGIKYSAARAASSPYVQGAYDKLTWEQRPDGSTYQVTAPFCRYLSWRESVLDHALFLHRDRYRPALDAYRATGDVDAYARAIHAAGYATDLAYADKLIALIDREGLRRYRPEEAIMPTVLSRAEWGARPPKGTPTRVSWPSIRYVDIHWPGSKGHLPTDKAGVAAALRGWQRFHQDERGWRDIAYNIAVDLAGRVWELRGWDVQDGGVAGRADDLTILLVIGADDELTDTLKASVLWVMREMERRKGAPLVHTWHGALTSTDCPGPRAIAWGRTGFPTPTTPTTTTTEEDMPTPADLLNAPIPRQGSAAGTDTTLAWEIGYLPANFAGLQASLAALSGQVAGLAAAASGETDLDKIAAAAKAGAEEALTASQGPLAAAVEDLTSALDQLDPAEITQAVSEAVARLRVIVAPAEEATHG